MSATRIGAVTAYGDRLAREVAAVAEDHYKHILSPQKMVRIPFLTGVTLADGAPIVVFANGTADGCQVTDSKAVTYRWNNGGTPPAIAVSVPMPQDLDDAAPVVVHALLSKSGATVGDAVRLTIGAFFQTVAALHDADADAGGDSSAIVGNATAKTVTEVTLTIAAADVPAAPCALTLTVKPKDGTLGTDDCMLHDLWLEYTPKLLTDG